MRLRSQDRTVDVPYELSTIQTKKSNREDEKSEFLIRAVMGGETFKLGMYTQKEKAIKVMDEIAARALRDEKGYNLPADAEV